MGGADFVNVLFSEFLVYDPKIHVGKSRPFLPRSGTYVTNAILSIGLSGKFTLEELAQFRQWGSPTPGHPEVDIMRGIENTSVHWDKVIHLLLVQPLQLNS